MLSKKITTAVPFVVSVLMVLIAGVPPTLTESHPLLFGFCMLPNFTGFIVATVPLAVTVLVAAGADASPAFAETHPFLSSFGSFTNPNGIAVEESTGDVYVADIGTDTVSRFDANGVPVNFSSLASNTLTGSATPDKSFSFPNASDTSAAIAIDNATSASDPSAGDLYVMDAGHNVVDKFSSTGAYLGQIKGPFSGELLGLGVDGSGSVRVDVKGDVVSHTGIDVFDNSATNSFDKTIHGGQEEPITREQERGFATGPQPGSDYPLLACGCVAKVGAAGENLGQVDNGSTGVAVAVDVATGHVYIDDQSSVTEWDTGQMNGPPPSEQNTGALISTFGSLQLTSSSGQGGIAVNGVSGDIYVSNPTDGQVYLFGSTSPAARAGVPANVTQTAATLQGVVDPRGIPVTSCEFEYATTPSIDLTLPIIHLGQSVPCEQTATQIGSGTSQVAVSANISTLEPGSLYHFRLVVGNANGTTPSAGLFPTVGAGFGIKNFEVSFLNKDDTPDTQAGSHPYEMVTSIVFKTNAVRRENINDLRYVTQPIGNAKDIITHLPPGFIGDPNATAKKCTLGELFPPGGAFTPECPTESVVGDLEAEYRDKKIPTEREDGAVFNMVPPPGVAVQLAAHLIKPIATIDVGIPAGGDSGARATVEGAPVTAPVLRTRLSILGGSPPGSKKPFLTLPSACNGPLTSTISADSYQSPGHFSPPVSSVTRNAAGTPGGMTGCAQLTFPPTINVKPDTSNASSPAGLNVGVHVSQKAAQNPEGLAESALRDTTVTLPAGVAINPADADGLEACSEGLAGFTGFTEFNPNVEPGDQTPTFTPELPNPLQPGSNFCPDGSKIGTVNLKTPLLEHELTGSVYLAAQEANPWGSLIAMYMVIEDPVSGTLVKLTGKVSLCESAGQVLDGVTCEALGQIVTTFKNTPELPFEDLEVHFFGGERAPLTTPSQCGTYTTKASFTPWDGNGPVNTTSSFQIEHGPHGSPCPGASLPFNPSLTAGTTNIQAGAFSPFTVTMSREDGEQSLQGISLRMPPGLLGMLSSVKLCGEAEANAGTCGPESEIGETTVSVGSGSEPFTVKGGKVYITGPYKGAPFGLSIVTPAKAGPFDLGTVVVRAKIDVDRHTSVLTVTTDPLPTMLKGIPLQIKHVNATIDRPGFTFNPTNCFGMQVNGTLSGAQGATSSSSVPFQVANCANLPFKPSFKSSTQAKTSKAAGASLKVQVGSGAGQANIAKTRIVFPKQLPARLTTLQKACTDTVFNADPSGCPAASAIGTAIAHTPVLKVPLTGPVYLVSHGGVAFPDAVIVLRGEGVTLYLDGNTNIKKGITSSTFNSVPDAPITSFEVTLPEGPHSAFATNVSAKAKGSMCGQSLQMPTVLTGQNGAVRTQTTKIAVTGCPKKKAKKASSHRHGKGKARKKR